MRRKSADRVAEVREWFRRSVTYEGEAYVMDDEQMEAVIDTSKNAIVVARAGSGKTRTIVAKIVYLVAKCGVKPDEIMTFVFNANAAREINDRLSKMCVDGVPMMEEVKIASTFHAFSRKVVYDVCGGRKRCGKILAGEKEEFVMAVVAGMMKEPRWEAKIRRFIDGGEESEIEEECSEDINGVMVRKREAKRRNLDERDLYRFAKMMALFINRAQQKFLAGENTLWESIRARYKAGDMSVREREFVQLGAECYRRYHWYLLDVDERGKLGEEFKEYGTDFNLIVSWASKLIAGGGEAVLSLLGGKKYLLIDEYQDFSQLFLSVVLAMRKVVPEVKLFVVGDDWQAINRFAGSDVEYFCGFERYFGDSSRRLPITTNYRCNYMIVDTARKFMKKGMGERGEFRAFSKRAGKVVLVNPVLTRCEYALVDYDRRVSGRDRIYMEMARRMLGRTPKRKTVRYVKTLVQVIRKNKKFAGILLLHRNNETNLEGMSLKDLVRGLKWGVNELGVMEDGEFDEKVSVMTMHKSKGLEAEVVIILEADEGVIPKLHPDTNLYAVFGETEKVALDDQKRLFYVAMTRAKKRLYIIHDESAGEGFVGYLWSGLDRWEGYGV